jgi:hypothetical protein
LLIGGTAVLLIGALVKFVPETAPARVALTAQAPASSQAADDASDANNDLPLPPNFPASLAQVVKLTRAGLGDEVVLAYVQNSNTHVAPTADEMIYLHRAGVGESVLAALVRRRPTPALAAQKPLPAVALKPPAPEMTENSSATPMPRETSAEPRPEEVALPTSPAPTPVAYNSEAPAPAIPNAAAIPAAARPPSDSDAAFFFDDLAPYGDWLQDSEGQWVWQPTVGQAVPDWTPYRDNGQWEFTDAGWAWASSYPWGWAPFHYGRWSNDTTRGWTWQPGSRWSPAWVAWRKSQSYYGWAPLPPGVSLNIQYFLPSNAETYGLAASSYTFVPAANFLSHNLAKHAASATKTASLLASSESLARSRIAGIPVEEVAAAVHMPITPLPLRDAPVAETRLPGARARDLAVYRPNVHSSSSGSGSASSKSPK